MPEPFTETPAQHLAEGFERRVERWSLAGGAPGDAARAAARAAREVSLAGANGHVCSHLDLLAPLPGESHEPDLIRTLLMASTVVGTPRSAGALPLILDDDGRLYLHRYFDYECRLAQRLVRAREPLPLSRDEKTRLRARLDSLFGPAADAGEPDWQKLAVALALERRVTLVSGGPGTGKTTMVVNLLACLLELDPGCRVALAAPTGKAAARMIDAIRDRAGHLPAGIRSALPAKSFTVHRLLGVTASGGFVHHADNLLPIDALIVDEASMLDLSLATRLLEAVPDTARIVLLGDKDQLAAVESGAVFAELSRGPALGDGCRERLAELSGTPVERIRPAAGAAPLEDCVVWFTRNFRFARDSGIGRLAEMVNTGAAAATLQWLRAGADASVRWVDSAGDTHPASPGQLAAEGYEAYVRAVNSDPLDHASISQAFARFRVLCSVREGPRGAQSLNTEITRRLRPQLPSHEADSTGPWHVGRPVLVRRNDYVLNLYNGDVGIALPDAAGRLTVFFPDATGGFREVAPARLPEHETAFAMTVHKSQGSEFEGILVVLPDQESRVLTRELLYTAITRARGKVTLCAGAEAIEAAVTTPTRRQSGLLARLAQARRARGG